MRASSELFELIHSLSQTEKRYFKIHAARHVIGEQNNYVKVFDYLERLNEYDEEKVKEYFKDEKFITNFHVIKRYLYDLIKKSLTTYHAENTVRAEIKTNLHFIEILFKKGLYEQCEKMLLHARKQAEKYQLFSSLIELYEWETELARSRSFINTNIKDMEEKYDKEMANVLTKQKIVSQYRLFTDKMMKKMNSSGPSRTKDDTQIFNQIMNHLKKEEKTEIEIPFWGQININFCYSTYFIIVNEFAKAEQFIDKTIHLYESQPHFKEFMPKPYVYAISNKCVCQIKLNQYTKALETIQKIKNTDAISDELKNRLSYIILFLELGVYIDTGRADKALDLIKHNKTAVDEIETRSFNIEDRYILNYNCARAYFIDEQYAIANKFLNKIINASQHNVRSDIYGAARLLQLIVFYETGKEELMEYAVKSTYRFFKKKNSLYKTEEIILDFIRQRIPKMYTEDDKMKAFKFIKLKLDAVMKDEFERKTLELFDIISWLESKIQRKKFADVLKEKSKKLEKSTMLKA